MVIMKTLDNVHRAVTTVSSAKGENIHNIPQWVGDVIAELLKLGITVGGIS